MTQYSNMFYLRDPLYLGLVDGDLLGVHGMVHLEAEL